MVVLYDYIEDYKKYTDLEDNNDLIAINQIALPWKKVIKYHPDKLQGVSQDIIKLAEEKFSLVQQAYENIMKSRL